MRRELWLPTSKVDAVARVVVGLHVVIGKVLSYRLVVHPCRYLYDGLGS
jgi:hypothetical protein